MLGREMESVGGKRIEERKIRRKEKKAYQTRKPSPPFCCFSSGETTGRSKAEGG